MFDDKLFIEKQMALLLEKMTEIEKKIDEANWKGAYGVSAGLQDIHERYKDLYKHYQTILNINLNY